MNKIPLSESEENKIGNIPNRAVASAITSLTKDPGDRDLAVAIAKRALREIEHPAHIV